MENRLSMRWNGKYAGPCTICQDFLTPAGTGAGFGTAARQTRARWSRGQTVKKTGRPYKTARPAGRDDTIIPNRDRGGMSYWTKGIAQKRIRSINTKKLPQG